MPEIEENTNLLRKKSQQTMWIDGALYASAALFVFSQGYFTSDEAYKYINPFVLFWIKYIIGGCSAVCVGLKAYRNTSFAENRQ